jgi:hypothetical protein
MRGLVWRNRRPSATEPSGREAPAGGRAGASRVRIAAGTRIWTNWAALISACLCLVAARGEASLSVSPSYLELELGKGRPSQALTVTNVTNEETRYRIQVIHFGFSKEGNVQTVPPDAHSLAPWIKCNPREFSLAPKASRAIRLTVIPPPSLAPGEYWAAVWFEPLSMPVDSTADSTSRKGQVHLMTNVLIPIFGQVPRVDYRGELTNLAAVRDPGGIRLVARLTNTGSGRLQVKGSYEILNAGGTQVAHGLIGEDTILAGGVRDFPQFAQGEFPDPEYTIRVRYESPKLAAVLAGQTSVRQE